MTARVASRGRIPNTYSSAARTSVPPPTARSGRRLTSLGRLFMRASVLLVSIPHPSVWVSLIKKRRPRRGAPVMRLCEDLPVVRHVPDVAVELGRVAGAGAGSIDYEGVCVHRVGVRYVSS